MKTLRDRFEAKYIPEPMSGCWIWTASIKPNGYGQIRAGTGVSYAHRVAYELYVGLIPEGMFVCHRCDICACCNPAHLFISDHAGNMRDMIAKERQVNLRGEAHGSSKLTEAEVMEIRAAPGTLKTIAARFEISKSHVGYIKRRKTWAHL